MPSAFGIEHGEVAKISLPGAAARAARKPTYVRLHKPPAQKPGKLTRLKSEAVIQGHRMASSTLNPGTKRQVLNGFAGLVT